MLEELVNCNKLSPSGRGTCFQVSQTIGLLQAPYPTYKYLITKEGRWVKRNIHLFIIKKNCLPVIHILSYTFISNKHEWPVLRYKNPRLSFNRFDVRLKGNNNVLRSYYLIIIKSRLYGNGSRTVNIFYRDAHGRMSLFSPLTSGENKTA